MLLKRGTENVELSARAGNRLQVAMYELDVTIGRAMTYDMLHMLPMALYVKFPH